MIPRSLDAQNRAQDLSTSILSASTVPQAASATAAVDAFLRRHASDQSRSFFSIAFPSLILRLFGFDSSAASSWIDLAAADADLSVKLFNLLSPSGTLFSSISSVDRHSVVRYVFPLERLPEWIRFVLQSNKLATSSLLADVCPLLKSRVKDNQIHLNVFEYYMFWFSYYPVCKGNSEIAKSGEVVRKSRKFRLEQWTSSLPSIVSPNRQTGQKAECNLYLRLLYAYLNAFVPKSGFGACQPYRSSLLHYSLSYDNSVFMQAEFLINTLVHFWMVDNDFSPLPMSICRSYGLSFPFRAVLGETPPTPGLGEVLNLLVKYLNCSLIAYAEGNNHMLSAESLVKKCLASGDSDRLSGAMVVCENSVGSWNSILQRPLYRFVLRTFLFCPIGASIKNAAQVFSLWVTYLTPWVISPEDFTELESPMVQNSENVRKESSNGKNDGKRKEPMYTPTWERYVASNYLFYSSLFVHFLVFAHKFLHMNVDAVIQMVLKVLDILTSSRELVEFIHKVDSVYHSKQSGACSSYADNVHKYIPSIREQLQDWEDGLCESDADGSFLHENWNHGLTLFSNGEDGAPKLLQLFVLRAEHEMQQISGDLQNLDSIKSKMCILFGSAVRTSYSTSAVEEPLDSQHDRVEFFSPKHPGVGKRTWDDVKYKGDWMKRPISDNEVAWLARVFIRLSDWLNDIIGLDQVEITNPAGPIYLDVPRDDTAYVGGSKEALVMVVVTIGSWLGLLVQSMSRFLRRHGMRVNLRVLASKKFVIVFVVYAVAYALKRVLWTASGNPLSS